MNEPSRSVEKTTSEVTPALHRLKQEGSRLLVTGEVGTAVRIQQTRRLLGSPREDRARILAFAGGASPSMYLPNPVALTDDRVTVVEHGDTVRSVAAASAEPLPPSLTSEDPLADFHTATLAAIDAEHDVSEPFAPAELRVGVVGLGTLVDRYGLDRTGRMVRSLGDAVTAHNGMFHCHVAGPADASQSVELQSAFDARIDLRHRDGFPPEQQWTFLETGVSTEWMLL